MIMWNQDISRHIKPQQPYSDRKIDKSYKKVNDMKTEIQKNKIPKSRKY